MLVLCELTFFVPFAGSSSFLSAPVMEVPQISMCLHSLPPLYSICISLAFNEFKTLSSDMALLLFLFHKDRYNWNYTPSWHSTMLLNNSREKCHYFLLPIVTPTWFPISINCTIMSPKSQDSNSTCDFSFSPNLFIAKSCKSHTFIFTVCPVFYPLCPIYTLIVRVHTSLHLAWIFVITSQLVSHHWSPLISIYLTLWPNQFSVYFKSHHISIKTLLFEISRCSHSMLWAHFSGRLLEVLKDFV